MKHVAHGTSSANNRDLSPLMPAVLFVCPHCEKQAEVQVTSVTRSRPCPHCSEFVVLQVSCKDRKSKRKALLIAPPGQPVSADEPLVKPGPGPAYEPQSLEGEVFERMKLDPEVREARRRLFIGAAVVAGLIALAVIMRYLPDSDSEHFTPVVQTDHSAPDLSSGPKPTKLPKNTVGLQYGSPDTKVDRQTTLTFQGLSTESEPGTEAAPDLPSEVTSAAARFLEARNTEELISAVADRKALEPIIRQHISEHPWQPVKYATLKLHEDSTNNDRHWRMVALLQDGTKREVNVVIDNQRHLVDWPSYVAWSTMGWRQFMSEKPGSLQVFRVMADQTTRYDHAFADPQGLLCIRLTDPAEPDSSPIFAYVDRQSNVGAEIDFHLRESRELPLRLTLRLRYPDDPMTNDQVWIDSVVTAGWITRDMKATAQR